jgi:hypothetical protein
MTREELIDDGWRPQACRVGTLYFKGDFFCRLDQDEAVVFSLSDDMHPLGRVKTLQEIAVLREKSDLEEIKRLDRRLVMLKLLFKEKYGHDPDIV